ncbi:SDR family oxidoreductase [Kitasatospora viridis]|uniref:NAD(P)-dependent dehydrogenase (Short-subunit alcohol dehydrogenase family) n=1 Tax=Kitasatospora viridis TaxID=281105 RepID=A0A561UGB3_9ACTN|nr:SDR family oxidoreductase [Kitasatospora viridis]TWF98407.1 NAD(P)-dependent dehydrogenase (short-subunit alcohol dehydrogenase family) [Kitasatospora viridis]
MDRLTGRTALVTGGSRGIGKGIALRLAAEGALVAVHYGGNDQAAKETVAEIEAAGGQAFAVRAELGVPGDAAALWAAFDAALAARGAEPGLDILVNNAGITAFGHTGEVAEADYDRVFAVNVKAPFFLVQQGLERLRDGGRIVNVSSGVTRIAFPVITAYSMTKGALDTFTRTLAQQLGGRGITVNAVAPGMVLTDMNPQLADPDERAAAGRLSVFDRVAEPADIADVVAFLASADGRWVTGQVLDATGGSFLGM